MLDGSSRSTSRIAMGRGRGLTAVPAFLAYVRSLCFFAFILQRFAHVLGRSSLSSPQICE